MARVEKKYLKISIPYNDVSVLKWLQNQNNMSDSIRQLIREDIERNGYDDMFCREVIPGAKRGRPTTAEIQYRAAQAEQAQQIHDTSVVEKKQEIKPVRMVRTPAQQKPEVQNSPAFDDDDFLDPEALLNL